MGQCAGFIHSGHRPFGGKTSWEMENKDACINARTIPRFRSYRYPAHAPLPTED